MLLSALIAGVLVIGVGVPAVMQAVVELGRRRVDTRVEHEVVLACLANADRLAEAAAEDVAIPARHDIAA
jgi:hypothetical protein